MNQAEVEAIARAVNNTLGEKEPCFVSSGRQFGFFGKKRWYVSFQCLRTNMGMNLTIDDKTGKVIRRKEFSFDMTPPQK